MNEDKLVRNDYEIGDGLQLSVFRYDSGKPGRHLLILGAMHGNETCGTEALNRLEDDINKGLQIKEGAVTFVPICNVPAYLKNVRQIDDRNLNRMIRDYPDPKSVEERTSNVLTRLIRESDALLDQHSCSALSEPFVIMDNRTPESEAYAAALGVRKWVTGWQDVVDKDKDEEASDTVAYALSQGKIGLTVECGQHKDPKAPEAAYRRARLALDYLNIADDSEPAQVVDDLQILNLFGKLVQADKQGTRVVEMTNFTQLKQGQVVVDYNDGTTLTADRDCYMVMPIPGAGAGDHLAFVGSPAPAPATLAAVLSPRGRPAPTKAAATPGSTT